MTTATLEAPVQTQEELDAAAEEQVLPISKEGLKRVRRLHKVRADLNRLKAEEDEIKKFLTDEMVSQNAKALSFKGVVAVAYEATTQVTNQITQLFKDYPMLLPIYQTRNEKAKRFALKSVV